MVLLYKLKISGKPVSSNPTGDILLTAFARSVFLCHILAFIAVLQNFRYICELICDQ